MVKLAKLKIREVNILSRNRYARSPGVLRKVQRQIATLEKDKTNSQ